MGTAQFTAGQMVFLKGDPGDMFYIVQHGSFSVFDRKWNACGCKLQTPAKGCGVMAA
jgi:hypothetical protein